MKWGALWVSLACAVFYSGCSEDERADSTKGTGGSSSGGATGGTSPQGCDGSWYYLKELVTDDENVGGLPISPQYISSGEHTGIEHCESGHNRASAVACGPFIVTQSSVCTQDTDLFPRYPHYSEYCDSFDVDAFREEGAESCEAPGCLVPANCQTDDDCGEGRACLCAMYEYAFNRHFEFQSTTRCVPANCRSNADCESGECGARRMACGNDFSGFACRTAEDECTVAAHCPENSYCDYSEEDGRWMCRAAPACE